MINSLREPNRKSSFSFLRRRLYSYSLISSSKRDLRFFPLVTKPRCTRCIRSGIWTGEWRFQRTSGMICLEQLSLLPPTSLLVESIIPESLVSFKWVYQRVVICMFIGLDVPDEEMTKRVVEIWSSVLGRWDS